MNVPSLVTRHSSPDPQQSLPLVGALEDALRQVYANSSLADHGITYDTAMRIPHMALALRRSAEALMRQRQLTQSGIR